MGMARLILIYAGVWLRQRKRRDLDIKLLIALINHLISPVHGSKRRRERAP